MQNKAVGFWEEDAFSLAAILLDHVIEMSPEYIWFRGNMGSQVTRIVSAIKEQENKVDTQWIISSTLLSGHFTSYFLLNV